MFRLPRIAIIVCLSLLNMGVCVAASNKIKLQYDFPTRLNLSLDHVNRIHFAGKQIQKLVGDSSQYNIILSENRKDMFVQLRAELGQIINLSVIDIAGKVVDLEILAINSKYPSIITLDDVDRNKIKDLEEEKEINKMMAAMKKGIKGKYYIIDGGKSFNCGAFGKNSNCQIIANYRFGKYRGIALRVENKGTNSILLDSNKIAEIIPYKVLKQTSSSFILPKLAKEVIYFVSKEVELDV